MIVKATWADGLTMLFGDSYRTWDDQLREYCRDRRLSRPTITTSPEQWISFGGLKWCSLENFQRELDREGYGRQVDDFRFTEPSLKSLMKLTAIGVDPCTESK